MNRRPTVFYGKEKNGGAEIAESGLEREKSHPVSFASLVPFCFFGLVGSLFTDGANSPILSSRPVPIELGNFRATV